MPRRDIQESVDEQKPRLGIQAIYRCETSLEASTHGGNRMEHVVVWRKSIQVPKIEA